MQGFLNISYRVCDGISYRVYYGDFYGIPTELPIGIRFPIRAPIRSDMGPAVCLSIGSPKGCPTVFL